ncbi:hypothetical protein ACCO45_012688 [Purpureocillium lilacinum]|uniref:Uncharacterized protein n=1 Tax=Purpureocillium lilacinum TaxID=33203 RepID=A0ACC4DBT9_PURLI
MKVDLVEIGTYQGPVLVSQALISPGYQAMQTSYTQMTSRQTGLHGGASNSTRKLQPAFVFLSSNSSFPLTEDDDTPDVAYVSDPEPTADVGENSIGACPYYTKSTDRKYTITLSLPNSRDVRAVPNPRYTKVESMEAQAYRNSS